MTLVAILRDARMESHCLPATKSMDATAVYHVTPSRGVSGPVGTEIVKYFLSKEGSLDPAARRMPDINVIVHTPKSGWVSLYDFDLETSISQFGPQVFLGSAAFKGDEDRFRAWTALIAYLTPRSANPAILGLLAKTESMLQQLEEAVVYKDELLTDELIMSVEDDFPAAYAAVPAVAAKFAALTAMPVAAGVEQSAYAAGHRRGRNVTSPGTARVRTATSGLTPLV